MVELLPSVCRGLGLICSGKKKTEVSIPEDRSQETGYVGGYTSLYFALDLKAQILGARVARNVGTRFSSCLFEVWSLIMGSLCFFASVEDF